MPTIRGEADVDPELPAYSREVEPGSQEIPQPQAAGVADLGLTATPADAMSADRGAGMVPSPGTDARASYPPSYAFTGAQQPQGSALPYASPNGPEGEDGLPSYTSSTSSTAGLR